MAIHLYIGTPGSGKTKQMLKDSMSEEDITYTIIFTIINIAIIWKGYKETK